MLIITAFLGGTVLAFSFSVIILLPAILLAWVIVLADGLLTASSGMSIALQMVLVAVVLQFGYVAAIAVKWAVLAGRRRYKSGRFAMVPDGTF
jgi:hypothetical protein